VVVVHCFCRRLSGQMNMEMTPARNDAKKDKIRLEPPTWRERSGGLKRAFWTR